MIDCIETYYILDFERGEEFKIMYDLQGCTRLVVLLLYIKYKNVIILKNNTNQNRVFRL